MALVKKFWLFGLAIFLLALFFYKTILFGLIPFPGDLLIAEYKPWSTYSYLGYNPGSFPNKAQYFDTLRQLYPWKTLVIHQLENFTLPFWNPYNFSGAPLLANFQSAVFYPLNIFYFVMPQIMAWSILVILQPTLAFLFTYFYCRKLKLSMLASSFAAISYGFSSFMTVWLEYNTIGHVIAWLPLALFAIEKLRDRWDRVWFLLFIFSLAFSLFAGHPQIFFTLLIFIAIYGFIRVPNHRFQLYLGILLAIGIGAVQLIPGFELIQNAARLPLPYDNIMQKVLIQPRQLIMLALPDFFGNPATRTYWPLDTYVGKVTSIGTIPLFFLLATLRAKFPLKKFFISTAVIVLVLSSNNPITALLYKLSVPGSPTLMMFLFGFSLSILTAFGIDQFRKESHTMKKVIVRGIQVTILLALFWLAAFKFSPVGTKSVYYAAILSVVTIFSFGIAVRKKQWMTLVLAFLLMVHIGDLWVAFQKFNPFSPIETLYPTAPVIEKLKSIQRFDRSWGLGAAGIEANFATQLGIYSPEGYDPLYPKIYGEFIGGKRSDAVLAPDATSVRNTLGVRYILDRSENASTEKTFPTNTYSLLYNQDGWKIFENKNAFPRAYLADKNAKAEIQSYSPNVITILTSAKINTLLFLTDTYYPGWKAYIDNSETMISKTSQSFRSIAVPEGNHTVRFVYQPTNWNIAVLISIGSLLVSVIFFLL